MKHMKASLMIVATLALSATAQQGIVGDNYPFIMWSDKAFDKPQEFAELVSSTQVIDSLKATIETTKVEQVLVVVKEGLNTRKLI